MADWAPSTTHDIKARLVRPPTRAPCNILKTSIAPYKPVPLHWKQTETNAVELQLSGFIGADPDDLISGAMIVLLKLYQYEYNTVTTTLHVPRIIHL